MTAQRTYWHLERFHRVPSDYEIASSRLLYYPSRGFAVRTPVTDWYEEFQRGSPFSATAWEDFADPLQTTYSSYVARQAIRESFVDGVFRSIEGSHHDVSLPTEWLQLLEGTLPVLRYPYHGLQMTAAYVAQLAPSGKLAILATFEAADQMRLIQRFAYRMAQLRWAYPAFGQESKHAWETHPVWQPLRRCIERLLVTYDLGEAFVALNLIVKPAMDRVFLGGLARAGETHTDGVLPKLLFSLKEDATWHHDWSDALVRHVSSCSEDAASAIARWVDDWRPGMAKALAALSELEAPRGQLNRSIEAALEELDQLAARLRSTPENTA